MSFTTKLLRIPKLPVQARRTMGTTAYAAYAAQQNWNGFNRKNDSPNLNHTPTAMKRWSIIDKQPPPVGKITEIHVYDFDNTLFKTPLPNTKIWNAHTIGTLANPGAFVNGGWWHDSRILAATGEGLAKEEPKAWSGWWNETIVELVKLTIEQDDAVCVLLTGRSESGFSELIKRMVNAKNLDFDIIALKPAAGPNNQSFSSTMAFKQEFLTSLMETYKHATEIRIYEDRPKHVKGFRDFLADYNRKQNGNQRTRGPIKGEVIQVADTSTNLDPVAEVAEVQHLINLHNESLPQRRAGVRGERLKIVKSVFYTGYLIEPADTARLLSLAAIPQHFYDSDLKFHANNIMIVPRACPNHILEKVGGMGSKMRWEVTGTACFENNIWAVCVKPVPPTAKFHTENPSPFVVLAVRKGARPVDAGKIQNWQPVPPDRAFSFETVVGEKVLLSVQAEDSADDAFTHAKSGTKRKHQEDDFRARPSHPTGPRNFNQFGGRGRAGGFRGGNNNRGGFRGQRGGGRGRGGRGGGGGHHYKSLDDVGTRENGQVSYEDDSAASRGFNTQPPLGPAAQYGGGGHGGWNNNKQGGGNNSNNGNGFGGFGDNY